MREDLAEGATRDSYGASLGISDLVEHCSGRRLVGTIVAVSYPLVRLRLVNPPPGGGEVWIEADSLRLLSKGDPTK
jgi:hypothetical protein